MDIARPPEALKAEIRQRLAEGQSIRKITRDLQVNWLVVKSIYRESESINRIQTARRALHELLPKATQNIRKAVEVDENIPVSLKVIEGLGVLDPPEKSTQQQTTVVVVSHIPDRHLNDDLHSEPLPTGAEATARPPR